MPLPPDPLPDPLPDPGAADLERDRILAAAAVVLGRTGYRHLKIRQVVTEARVSSRSFYRHFASKTDLMLTLLADDARATLVQLDALLAQDDDPVARVAHWIGFCVRGVLEEGVAGPARCFLDPELQRDAAPQLAALRRAGVERLTAAIRDGVRAGRFVGATPERDAVALQYVVQGYLGDVRAGVRSASSEEAARDLLGFALQALGCPDDVIVATLCPGWGAAAALTPVDDASADQGELGLGA